MLEVNKKFRYYQSCVRWMSSVPTIAFIHVHTCIALGAQADARLTDDQEVAGIISSDSAKSFSGS